MSLQLHSRLPDDVYMPLPVEERIARAERAHREGRIINKGWRDGEGGVCPLAAFGVGSRASVPVALMPHWLTDTVPVIADQLTQDELPWFMGELLNIVKRRIGRDAWERARISFMGWLTLEVAKAAIAKGDRVPDSTLWTGPWAAHKAAEIARLSYRTIAEAMFAACYSQLVVPVGAE